jgi:hypothetical protein
MTPAGSALFGGIQDVFQYWIGWGWGLTGAVYIAGVVFILKVVDKRFASRLSTAAVVVVWTVAVLSLASALFGVKPPPLTERP